MCQLSCAFCVYHTGISQKKYRCDFFRFPSSSTSPMANLPSSSSPQSLSSASNSDNSPATDTKPTSHSSLSPKLQVDAGENNFDEKTPEVATNFQYLYLANHIEKFKKYEADYARRLMAKYFSKKNLYGGNVFDENVTIDNELIKSSRWPCTRSYADTVKAFEDQNSSESVTVNETPSNISNGKHLPKKNGDDLVLKYGGISFLSLMDYRDAVMAREK